MMESEDIVEQTSPDGKNYALFSKLKKYRYKLIRIWDETLPKIFFLMLNPSIGGAEDDPTIKICKNFAKNLGPEKYGGIYIGNLIPYISSKPRDLTRNNRIQILLPNPNFNIQCIEDMAKKCSLFILSYGNITRSVFRTIRRNLNYLPTIKWNCLKVEKQPKYPPHPARKKLLGYIPYPQALNMN